MLKRRTFLKLTGIAAAGQALGAASLVGSHAALGGTPSVSAAGLSPVSSTMRLRLTEPGTYLVSGQVRIMAPTVEIAGITNAQQLSWSGIAPSEMPLASFSSYEMITSPNALSEVRVVGGKIESLTATPVSE